MELSPLDYGFLFLLYSILAADNFDNYSKNRKIPGETLVKTMVWMGVLGNENRRSQGKKKQ